MLEYDRCRDRVLVKDGHLGGYIQGGDSLTQCPTTWDFFLNLGVKSFLDIGCGEGQAMKYFADRDCEVCGIEGCSEAIRKHVMPSRVLNHDYRNGPLEMIPYDLVWCCEVLEHIEEEFLPNVRMEGKFIAISPATVGQKGHHHVNCQLPEYWINVMQLRGRRLAPEITKASKIGLDPKNYYARNGMVFI